MVSLSTFRACQIRATPAGAGLQQNNHRRNAVEAGVRENSATDSMFQFVTGIKVVSGASILSVNSALHCGKLWSDSRSTRKKICTLNIRGRHNADSHAGGLLSAVRENLKFLWPINVIWVVQSSC